MNSSSKVLPPNSRKNVSGWLITDLDVESNVVPAEVQSEHILAFFGTGQKSASTIRDDGFRSTLRPNGTVLSLTNWLPDDLDLESTSTEKEQWEMLDSDSDFFNLPEQQILKEKFDAEKERVEIIKSARIQAETILKEARMEAEYIIGNAHSEIEQAKQAGYESARNELQGALSATHALIAETHEWQAALMKNSEQTLMDMLKEIAQAIFGEGVRLDPNALQMNLSRIMDNAQRLGDMTIFLNPADADQLDTSWRDYQLLVTGNKVRVLPSAKIKPGGCIVKGSMGMVDARVETQLSAVLNTIDEVNEVGK
jgi:type III secretion protein L